MRSLAEKKTVGGNQETQVTFVVDLSPKEERQ
jgi:hypothetical protein